MALYSIVQTVEQFDAETRALEAAGKKRPTCPDCGAVSMLPIDIIVSACGCGYRAPDGVKGATINTPMPTLCPLATWPPHWQGE